MGTNAEKTYKQRLIAYMRLKNLILWRGGVKYYLTTAADIREIQFEWSEPQCQIVVEQIETSLEWMRKQNDPFIDDAALCPWCIVYGSNSTHCNLSCGYGYRNGVCCNGTSNRYERLCRSTDNGSSVASILQQEDGLYLRSLKI